MPLRHKLATISSDALQASRKIKHLPHLLDGPFLFDHDKKKKGRLLATFCPVLRFDAAEKHFPVSVEAFISSSVLLKQDKPPQEAQDCSSYRPDGAAAAAAATGATVSDASRTRHDEKRTKVNGHACGECGEKEGWSVPRKGGWTVFPTPSGVKSWNTAALLETQRLLGDRYNFRCAWLVRVAVMCRLLIQ